MSLLDSRSSISWWAALCHSENGSMRLLISLIVIVYIAGIGVVLAPTIQTKWNTASASEFVTSVAQALPNAAAWPVRFYHSVMERG
jgi:hypothetical protein